MSDILSQLLYFVIAAGVLGLAAHFIGEAVPRSLFKYDRFPYKCAAFEKNGAIYARLHVQSWKDKLPDKSKFVGKMYRKSAFDHHTRDGIERLVRETCVAEATHWLLLFISPLFLLFMHGAFGICVTALYGLSNIPFIIIQRYNRPRLVALLRRFKTVNEQ